MPKIDDGLVDALARAGLSPVAIALLIVAVVALLNLKSLGYCVRTIMDGILDFLKFMHRSRMEWAKFHNSAQARRGRKGGGKPQRGGAASKGRPKGPT